MKINSGKKPSLRLTKTFKNVLENGGNVSKAMLDGGYSESTAKNPQKITKSAGWQKLMQKFLPDTLLVKKHRELLEAKTIEYLDLPISVKDEEIRKMLKGANCILKDLKRGDTQIKVWFWAQDATAIKNALDMAYKLKGRYELENPLINVEQQFRINIRSINDRLKLGPNKQAGGGVEVPRG